MGDPPTDRAGGGTDPDVAGLLARKVVGQRTAVRYITPFVQMYRARLNPPNRPAGIFLLLGPPGTGKTRTVEALAEILHGSARQLLKIDCAEYQSDHEVAKLIGAPPGYIGHRETKPLLTAERLLGVVSPECDLALVLFDEIEKAAPSLTTLLLGVLDKASMRLGDNTDVDFEKTFIFMTSNLGSREMLKAVRPDFGFQGPGRTPVDLADQLESIGLGAVRRRFSPEFVNRLDVIITYQPLDAESLAEILDHQIRELQHHVHTRLGERSFEIEVPPPARRLLLERGTSAEFGARELKRTIHRLLTQPLAALVADARIEPGARVVAEVTPEGDTLTLETANPRSAPKTGSALPVVVVVDDNAHLAEWLRESLSDRAGVTALCAATMQQARDIGTQQRIDLLVVDLLLPDGDGLTLAFELLRLWPRLQVILMSGTTLSPDEVLLCKRQDFPFLQKPFLASDVLGLARARLLHSAAAGA